MLRKEKKWKLQIYVNSGHVCDSLIWGTANVHCSTYAIGRYLKEYQVNQSAISELSRSWRVQMTETLAGSGDRGVL